MRCRRAHPARDVHQCSLPSTRRYIIRLFVMACVCAAHVWTVLESYRQVRTPRLCARFTTPRAQGRSFHSYSYAYARLARSKACRACAHDRLQRSVDRCVAGQPSGSMLCRSRWLSKTAGCVNTLRRCLNLRACRQEGAACCTYCSQLVGAQRTNSLGTHPPLHVARPCLDTLKHFAKSYMVGSVAWNNADYCYDPDPPGAPGPFRKAACSSWTSSKARWAAVTSPRRAHHRQAARPPRSRAGCASPRCFSLQALLCDRAAANWLHGVMHVVCGTRSIECRGSRFDGGLSCRVWPPHPSAHACSVRHS